MAWRASSVLLALVVACGGSSDGIGGAGGDAGTAGTGGEPEPKSCVTTEDCDPAFHCAMFENDDNFVCVDPGTLIDPCTDVHESGTPGTEDHRRTEHGVVPVEPGEIVLISTCYNYVLVDGEEVEPHLPKLAETCHTFRVEDGGPDDHHHEVDGEVKALCRDQSSPGNEYGFREVYFAREATE